MLLAIGGKCIGHCQEHTANYNTETKDHAVKPAASKPKGMALFKQTTVSGLSMTVSFKGLEADNETELSAETLKALWKAGKPVKAELFDRPAAGVQGNTSRNPYCKGDFIITKLTESSPADDDVSFDGELQLTGEPEVWTPAIPTEEVNNYYSAAEQAVQP